MVGVVVSRTLTGVFFGTFYELTRNVYSVALLHGFGNTWPLLIKWSDWSGTPFIAFFTGVVLFYVGGTLGYRYWAVDTALTPVVVEATQGPVAVDLNRFRCPLRQIISAMKKSHYQNLIKILYLMVYT